MTGISEDTQNKGGVFMADLMILIIVNMLMFLGIYTLTDNNIFISIFIWVLLFVTINTLYFEEGE